MQEIIQEQAMGNKVCKLKISELFSTDRTDRYRIPIYQRDYAWGKQEIHQLIQDIEDSRKSGVQDVKDSIEEKKEKKYYIGTLVVDKKDKKDGSTETIYEVIDGQQRLTTLFILLCVLKREYGDKIEFQHKLDFESRPKSKVALKQIFCEQFDTSSETEYQDSILDGYEIVQNAINKIKAEEKEEKEPQKTFFDYLLENVILYRVVTPKKIDVNHYFEIMNTRGEQLEKHEILKAELMAKLSPSARKWFAEIWNACSDMNKYVKIKVEDNIPRENDEGNGNGENSDATTNGAVSIVDIIEGNGDVTESNDSQRGDNTEERFKSIINFPNFLLHVFNLCFPDKEVSLDDKQLLNHFKNKKINSEEQINDFAKSLLNYRKLFDKYIIKQDFQDNSEKWVIKCIDEDNNYRATFPSTQNTNEIDSEDDLDIGKDIMMLQAMFHVSNPAMTNKRWLFETLRWIGNHDQEQDFAPNLEEHLRKRAREQLKNYFPDDDPKSANVLDQGTQVPHFIFNYLDYLLWKKEEYFGDKQKPDDFVFKFNNSVEHFYPQHPSVGGELSDEILNKLNDFGNLALISRSQNSRHSNLMPEAKVRQYKDSATKQSLKLKLMMGITTHKSKSEDEIKWGVKEIEEHGDEMKKLLLDSLNNPDPPNNP